MPKCIARALLISIWVCCAFPVHKSRADYVTLSSGGEIRGELQTDAKAKVLPELITIRTLSGATIVVSRAEVETIVRRRLVLEEYETLRRSAADTLDAQWELAEWCRKKSLSKERETHLLSVIALNREHTLARRALAGSEIEQAYLAAAETNGHFAVEGHVRQHELDVGRVIAAAPESLNASRHFARGQERRLAERHVAEERM
jgi:multidrug resistance efflux pump